MHIENFFNKGLNLTNDAKTNIVITFALLGGVLYYIGNKQGFVSFASTKVKAGDANADALIRRITKWIVNRSVDRNTSFKNIASIKQNVAAHRVHIEALIQEFFTGNLTRTEFKRKLQQIGVQTANEMNIALKSKDKNPNSPGRGYAKGKVKKGMAGVSNYYNGLLL